MQQDLTPTSEQDNKQTQQQKTQSSGAAGYSSSGVLGGGSGYVSPDDLRSILKSLTALQHGGGSGSMQILQKIIEIIMLLLSKFGLGGPIGNSSFSGGAVPGGQPQGGQASAQSHVHGPGPKAGPGTGINLMGVTTGESSTDDHVHGTPKPPRPNARPRTGINLMGVTTGESSTDDHVHGTPKPPRPNARPRTGINLMGVTTGESSTDDHVHGTPKPPRPNARPRTGMNLMGVTTGESSTEGGVEGNIYEEYDNEQNQEEDVYEPISLGSGSGMDLMGATTGESSTEGGVEGNIYEEYDNEQNQEENVYSVINDNMVGAGYVEGTPPTPPPPRIGGFDVLAHRLLEAEKNREEGNYSGIVDNASNAVTYDQASPAYDIPKPPRPKARPRTHINLMGATTGESSTEGGVEGNIYEEYDNEQNQEEDVYEPISLGSGSGMDLMGATTGESSTEGGVEGNIYEEYDNEQNQEENVYSVINDNMVGAGYVEGTPPTPPPPRIGGFDVLAHRLLEAEKNREEGNYSGIVDNASVEEEDMYDEVMYEGRRQGFHEWKAAPAPSPSGHRPDDVNAVTYDEASPTYDQASPTYDQASPTYDQASPAYDIPKPPRPKARPRTHDEVSPTYDQASPAYDIPKPPRPKARPRTHDEVSPTYDQASPAYDIPKPPRPKARPRTHINLMDATTTENSTNDAATEAATTTESPTQAGAETESADEEKLNEIDKAWREQYANTRLTEPSSEMAKMGVTMEAMKNLSIVGASLAHEKIVDTASKLSTISAEHLEEEGNLGKLRTRSGAIRDAVTKLSGLKKLVELEHSEENFQFYKEIIGLEERSIAGAPAREWGTAGDQAQKANEVLATGGPGIMGTIAKDLNAWGRDIGDFNARFGENPEIKKLLSSAAIPAGVPSGKQKDKKKKGGNFWRKFRGGKK